MLTNVYAEEPVDSVSIPFTSTNTQNPNPYPVGIFLPDPPEMRRCLANVTAVFGQGHRPKGKGKC